jgi:hypothetical protein
MNSKPGVQIEEPTVARHLYANFALYVRLESNTQGSGRVFSKTLYSLGCSLSPPKEGNFMFTRFIEFDIKLEKKDEFLNVIEREILPILKKQPGFLELLPFLPENFKETRMFSISLWNKKSDAERYEKEWYPKVYELMKPYLSVPTVTVRFYNLQTSLCKEFAHTFVA